MSKRQVFSLLTVVSIGFLAFVSTGAKDSGCPPVTCIYVTWEETGHRYAVCYPPDVETDWESARVACQSMSPSMELVTINDVAEQAFLDTVWDEFRLLSKPVVNHVGHDEYVAFIGFNDIAQEGQWVWASGEEGTYTNWCGGEPNNAGMGEHCAVMGWSADYEQGVECPELGWNDIPCSGPAPYICESVD